VLFGLVSRKPKDFSSDYHQLHYYSYIDRIRSNSQHNILIVMQMEHSQGRFFLSDWRDHRANPPCLAEDYHKTVAPSNIPYRNPQPLLPVMEPAALKDSLHNSPLGHLMLSRMTPILPEAHFDPGFKGEQKGSLDLPGKLPHYESYRTSTHYNTNSTLESERSNKEKLRGDLNDNNIRSSNGETSSSSQILQAYTNADADIATGNEGFKESITTPREGSETEPLPSSMSLSFPTSTPSSSASISPVSQSSSFTSPSTLSLIIWRSYGDEACTRLRSLAEAAEYERLDIRSLSLAEQSLTGQTVCTNNSLDRVQTLTPSGSKSPENEPPKGPRTPDRKSPEGAIPSPPSSGEEDCHGIEPNIDSPQPALVLAQVTLEENDAVKSSVLAAPRVILKHTTALQVTIDEEIIYHARILSTIGQKEEILKRVYSQNARLDALVPWDPEEFKWGSDHEIEVNEKGGPSHPKSLRSSKGKSAQQATDIKNHASRVNTSTIFSAPAKEIDAVLAATNDNERDCDTEIDEQWASPTRSKKRGNGTGDETEGDEQYPSPPRSKKRKSGSGKDTKTDKKRVSPPAPQTKNRGSDKIEVGEEYSSPARPKTSKKENKRSGKGIQTNKQNVSPPDSK